MANSRPSPIRDIRSLKTNLRETAERLIALDEAVTFYRVSFSLPKYLKDNGERLAIVDLAVATKTLRMYAGFLQLGIDAARPKTRQVGAG
jgi:hypothetical protein